MASRLAAGCPWDVLVSPAFPGELPPSDVPATIELTDRMTAYTRPVNWLGWPSAVTADGVMHTGRDEAAVLSHALAWEALARPGRVQSGWVRSTLEGMWTPERVRGPISLPEALELSSARPERSGARTR